MTLEYYDQEHGGKIPVFKPTLEEFLDFKKFMTSVEEYGKVSGIIKVIPPKEWKDQLPSLDLNQVKVTKPITQHIIGGRGVYNQTNIEDRKEYSLQEWKELCQRIEHRPPMKETSGLSTDQYKDIERHYWRNITFHQPMYGADLLGTLFDPSVTSWNPNTLDNTLNQLGVMVPGVNSPYLYYGMWKATFPWHVEDMDLYSINYIHFGAPKQWYVIQPCHQKRFENFMQTTFFNQYKECREFLRHKTFIVSPHVLQNNNIPVQRCVQQQGEFIITFPFGYHSGYNLDFNCAESVNFALDSWIEIGKRAKSCTCIDDSVVIDMESLVSTKSDEESKVVEDESSCVLCSMDHPLREHKETLNSYDGKYTHIHRICAESIEETYIKDNLVYGIEDIPNARWKLVCIFCKRKNKGACMQCCFGKCWRSFHATCAVENNATMTKIESSYHGYCPIHDPKLISEKKLQHKKYVEEMKRKLKPKLSIYTKWRGGGYYQGTIVDCRPSKETCRVLLQDGVTRIVPWRDIYLEKPNDL